VGFRGSRRGRTCGEPCGQKQWEGARFFRCQAVSKERPSRLEVLRHIEPRIILIAEVDGGAEVLCLRVSALCRRRTGRAQPSPPVGPSRPRGPSEGSRGAGFHPQVVNSLGTIQLTGTWAAHRWKAPRVRRISLLFAEGRVRRPCGLGASWACEVGSPWCTSRMRACRACWARAPGTAPGSPAGVATVSRQEVLEWIGLGRSSRCAHLRVPAREASSANSGRPLTRESSVGVAWKPGRAQRPACRSRGSRGADPPSAGTRGPQGLGSRQATRKARHGGQPSTHRPGIGRSAVVLAGCSGCRNRRAAPGPRLRAWV
jgi:hypothetical protein